MSIKKIRFLLSATVFLLVLGIEGYKYYFPSKDVLSQTSEKPTIQATNSYKVSKVIDGDTIDVLINNKSVKVRVIGINTPETVDPRRPVQCFGREASDHAKSILTNQMVQLEPDLTQSDKDKYSRLLRYVFLPDGKDYGLIMIKEGYAYEYTYELPYKFQKEYKAAQNEAENLKVGLWSDNSCKGKLR